MSSDRTTELLNLMSAMAREVGLLRQETNARFDQLEARFDRLEVEVKEIKVDVREIKRDIRILHEDRFSDARKVDDLEQRVEALEGEPV